MLRPDDMLAKEKEFYLSATNPHVSNTQFWDFPVPAWSLQGYMVYPQLKQTAVCSPHQKVASLSSRRLQALAPAARESRGIWFC